MLQWSIPFLIKKSVSLVDKSTCGGAVKNEIISHQKLAEELRKPFIRKFNKTNAHSSFIESVWGTDLADVQLVSKFDKRFRLMCY